MSNATRIEVVLDDGTVLSAEGEVAAKVWKWLQSCEALAVVHGARYEGEPMTERRVSDGN